MIYQAVPILIILIVALSVHGETHWIRKGIGEPTAATLVDSTLLLSTKSELVAALDAETGRVRWRHTLSSSKKQIVAFQWLSAEYTVVFENDNSSVLAQFLDSQTGELLSQLVLCDRAEDDDCLSYTEDCLLIQKVDRHKVFVDSSKKKSFIYDISSDVVTTDSLPERSGGTSHQNQKLSQCPQEDEEFERCFLLEEHVLHVSSTDRLRLRASSDPKVLWTLSAATFDAMNYLAIPEQQILAAFSGNNVHGLSLKDGSIKWSTEIVPEGRRPRTRRIVPIDSRFFAILQSVSGSSQEAPTVLTTIDVKSGTVVEAHDFLANVTQATTVDIRLKEDRSIAILSASGNIELHNTDSTRESGNEIAPTYLYWIRKLGPCMVGAFLSGIEQWSMKVPNCESIFSITATDPLAGRKSTGREVVYSTAGEALLRHRGDSLVAIVARDSTSQTITVIDGVTGAVLETSRNKGLDDNIAIVVAQNWIAYTTWNTQYMVQELHLAEFFEAHVDKVKTRSQTQRKNMESTLTRTPRVLRSSYAISSRIKTLGTTSTKKGITEKALVFGLESGQVVVIPKLFMEPRKLKKRRAGKSSQTAPYRPALSLDPEGDEIHATKKMSISHLQGVMGSPSSNRESVVHLVAVGLDIFHSLITPSGSFDGLSAGFNKAGVVVVTAVIFVLTIFARDWSLRSQVAQEWS